MKLKSSILQIEFIEFNNSRSLEPAKILVTIADTFTYKTKFPRMERKFYRSAFSLFELKTTEEQEKNDEHGGKRRESWEEDHSRRIEGQNSVPLLGSIVTRTAVFNKRQLAKEGKEASKERGEFPTRLDARR